MVPTSTIGNRCVLCSRQLDVADPVCQTLDEQATCRSGVQGIDPFVALQVNLGGLLAQVGSMIRITTIAKQPWAEKLVVLFETLGFLGARQSLDLESDRLTHMNKQLPILPSAAVYDYNRKIVPVLPWDKQRIF